ncbi:MAG TPA: biopolymer transporter ExbD [Cyanobacteria bacterium UBA9273]|nr:biopolymer transporter ExbD [Cyanobacteria bacterium UBA9273]
MRQVDDELDSPAQINIVPMIDVIFSILAFFIISTLYLTRSEGLPVNLPKAATAETQRTAQINVTVKPDGELALNRQPIELNQLEAGVDELIEPNSEAIVVINADEKVDHGQVVSVMDRLRRVKGAKLAIATQR